jgi:frizzled protein 1/7
MVWSVVLLVWVGLVSEGLGQYGGGKGRPVSERDSLPHHNKCEPITVPFCMDIQYNDTIMPNLLNHAKQEDAGLEVHQFFPLVKVKCNPDLQFFLCSVFVPVCTILDRPIPPCRSLCLSARQGCDELMNKFGFPWPENLDCDRFPEPPDICVGDNNTTSSNTGSKYKYVGGKEDRSRGQQYPLAEPPLAGKLPEGAMDYGFVCPVQFKVPKGYGYSLKVGDKLEKDCGAPCTGMFFSEDQRRFARIWVGVWSVLCFASCLFTVLTFLIDTDR